MVAKVKELSPRPPHLNTQPYCVCTLSCACLQTETLAYPLTKEKQPSPKGSFLLFSIKSEPRMTRKKTSVAVCTILTSIPYTRFKIRPIGFYLFLCSLQLPEQLLASAEEKGKTNSCTSELYIHQHTFFYLGCTLILVDIFIEVFCYNCTKTNQVKLVICYGNHEHACFTFVF